MFQTSYKWWSVFLVCAMVSPYAYAQEDLSSPIRTQGGGTVFQKPFSETTDNSEIERQNLSMPDSHSHGNVVEDLDYTVSVWARQSLGIEDGDAQKAEETLSKALDNSPRETVLERMDGDEMTMAELRQSLATDENGHHIVPMRGGGLLLWNISKRSGLYKYGESERAFHNVERIYRHGLFCAGGANNNYSNCAEGEISERKHHEQNQNIYIGSSVHMKSKEQGAVYDWHGSETQITDVDIEMEKEEVRDDTFKDELLARLSSHASWVSEKLSETNREIAAQDMAVEMGGKKIDGKIMELSLLLEKLKPLAAESQNKELNEYVASADDFLERDLEELINAYLTQRSENMEIFHERKSELDRARLLLPEIKDEIERSDSEEISEAALAKFETWTREAVQILSVSDEDKQEGHGIFGLLDELIDLGKGFAASSEQMADEAERTKLGAALSRLGDVLGRSIELKQKYARYEEAYASLDESAGLARLPFEPAIQAMLDIEERYQNMLELFDAGDFNQLRQVLSALKPDVINPGAYEFDEIADAYELRMQEMMNLIAEKKDQYRTRLQSEKEQADKDFQENVISLRKAAEAAGNRMSAVVNIQNRISDKRLVLETRLGETQNATDRWRKKALNWVEKSRHLETDLNTLRSGFNSIVQRISVVLPDSNEEKPLDLSEEEMNGVRDFIRERSLSLKPIYANAKTIYTSLMSAHGEIMRPEERAEVEKPVEKIKVRVDSEASVNLPVVVSESKPKDLTVEEITEEDQQETELAEDKKDDIEIEMREPVSLVKDIVDRSEPVTMPVEKEIELPLPAAQEKQVQPPVQRSADKIQAYYLKLLENEPELMRLELSLNDLKDRIKNLDKQMRLLKLSENAEMKQIRESLINPKPDMEKLFRRLKRDKDPEDTIHAIIGLRREMLTDKTALQQLKALIDEAVDREIEIDLSRRKQEREKIYTQLD